MRASTAAIAFFLGKALAVSRSECILNNSKDLAAYTDCGHEEALAYCLAHLQTFEEKDVQKCYTKVGCSDSAAEIETKYTLSRCAEISKGGELRKRYQSAPEPTEPVYEQLQRRGDTKSGYSDCYSTGTKSTSTCDTVTSGSKTTTAACKDTVITTSSCAPTMLCTLDSTNNPICMEKHSMDTGGIIIAVVFAGLLVLCLGALTFMCIKDRKDQKRLAAKAEAVALARAATKKKKNADRARRAPGAGAGGNGGNPFQDGNRI